MATLEQFRCDELRSWQTRQSCADRYARASNPPDNLSKADREQLRRSVCAGCRIGRAHARGDRPNVRLRIVDESGAPTEEEVVLTTKRDYGQGPRLLTHPETGVEGTVSWWADEIGVSRKTLYRRLKAGLEISEVLAPPGTAVTRVETPTVLESSREAAAMVTPATAELAELPMPERVARLERLATMLGFDIEAVPFDGNQVVLLVRVA